MIERTLYILYDIMGYQGSRCKQDIVMFELRSLFFKLKYSRPGREQLYNLVHERDSRLYNNVYVNGVQAASRSSMNFVLFGCSGPFRIQVGWMPVQRVTLRVIAVISLDIALVSQAVSFRTQPAELELTMPSVTRWVCMGCQLEQPNLHGVPGPGYSSCWLQVCCMSLR